MSPYTKLSVRTLGPATGLTLDAHRQVPTHVPNSPSRGTRRHGDLFAVPQRQDWWDHAVCAAKPTELFFGAREAAKTAASNRAAKKVCATCSVQDPCLNYALDNNERWGVWGGLTPRERSKMLTARESLRVSRAVLRHVTDEQACGKVTREEAGTLATSGPSEDTPVTTGDASMSTVPNPSTPVKSSRE